MNATRSYSKRPSPSDTEYEIARVRGDALVRCYPRCKQRVVQVPPAKARRPSPAADSPKKTPGLTQPSQQKSQQPPTPPAPQETEDSMLGKHPRDDLSDTNDSDTSGAGATLLTTTTPARQVRLIYIFSRSGTRNLKLKGGLQINLARTPKAVAQFGPGPERTNTPRGVRIEDESTTQPCT